jgi:hypothetical protein
VEEGGSAGDFFRAREASKVQKWRWRENIPPLTPSGNAAARIRGGAVNAVPWDGIGRAEVVAGELVGVVACGGGDAWR